MEFNQEDLLRALNGHYKTVKRWIHSLEKNLHQEPFWRRLADLRPSPKGNPKDLAWAIEGQSCIKSERQTENDQHDASPCFETISTLIQNFEKEMDKVIKNLPETERKEQSTRAEKKSTTTVQVYDRAGNLADDFMKAANKWTRYQFTMKNVKEVSYIDKDKPLLLLCLADSRLKSDVDYASELITNLEDYQKAAFVVIHSKEVFVFPDISSQIVLREDEKYKDVHFIDAAFTKKQKYYNCKRNSDAARKLLDFLPKIGSADHSFLPNPAYLDYMGF